MKPRSSKNTVRINVSIPADLYSRMKRYMRDENWSAIATKAFEEAMLKKDGKTLEERLVELEQGIAKFGEWMKQRENSSPG